MYNVNKKSLDKKIEDVQKKQQKTDVKCFKYTNWRN